MSVDILTLHVNCATPPLKKSPPPPKKNPPKNEFPTSKLYRRRTYGGRYTLYVGYDTILGTILYEAFLYF